MGLWCFLDIMLSWSGIMLRTSPIISHLSLTTKLYQLLQYTNE